MAESSHAWHLFLDESGTFTEELDGGSVPRIPSQLAGLLIPAAGGNAAAAADRILAKCRQAAGLAEGSQLHATNVPTGKGYDAMVQVLVEQLDRHRWQPVRFVNDEHVAFGDRAANYTTMVAELAVRLWQTGLSEGRRQLVLECTCARVMLLEQDTIVGQIGRDQYLERINAAVALTALRRGHSFRAAPLRVTSFGLASARTDPFLQLCDVVSNASHSNFRRCGDAARDSLQRALGRYDHRLVVRVLLDRLDLLINEGAAGFALLTLMLELADRGRFDLDAAERERLDRLTASLAGSPSRLRDGHLRMALEWLPYLVEHRREPTLGGRAAQWLDGEVRKSLQARLTNGADAESLAWFGHAVALWALSAANHRGALVEAAAVARGLDELAPPLAARVEWAPQVLEGLVVKAVHLTDCGEFDRASGLARGVASFFDNLGALYRDAHDRVFPAIMRSELRGRALGTWLQSEVVAGAADPARLGAARELSDRAIEDLDGDDRLRQYQYRCHLETVAGDHAAALSFLARALGCDPSHQAVATHIAALEPTDARTGFALLHWLRLGHAVAGGAAAAAGTEGEDFVAALGRSRLLHGPWARGKLPDYPAHGIVRRRAAYHAGRGERDESLSALADLWRLDAPGSERLLLQMVQLAGHLEVAGHLWVTEPRHARKLLTEAVAGGPTLRVRVANLSRRLAPVAPTVARELLRWAAAAEAAADSKAFDPHAGPSLACVPARFTY